MKKIWLLTLLLSSGLLKAVGDIEPEGRRAFRAGAATSNISPQLGASINGGMQDRKAAVIHDELQARCLVLDDGATRLAFVICDSCMIPREVCDQAKRLIHRDAGLKPAHVLIAATHTHSAPAAAPVFQSEPNIEYQEFLARRIADGVVQAVRNLAPARIGWGFGSVPDHVFNRRWWMKAGSIPPDPFGRRTDQVKMNPPVGSPNLIKPAGPTDPQLAVVSIQSHDGRPLALLANYSLHYVGGTGPSHISADYFGMFAERIQHLLKAERADPPFVAMMSNGTSGDINNIDFRNPAPPRMPYEQMRRVAHAVADEAYRVSGEIKYRDHVPLAARRTTLRLKVRRPDRAELERAAVIGARADSRELRTVEEIYARETVLLNKYPKEVEVVLQALRLGDLGIAAIPCEVFVEIGLEIQQKSPFPAAFTIELANGYHGYLPTVEHHKLGGYETWRARSSYLEVEAAPKIVAQIMSMLGRLR